MSLQLSSRDIYFKISTRRWTIKKDVLVEQLIKTFNTTEILLLYLKNDLIVFSSNNKYGNISPLLWAYGHILFFWEQKTLKNLGIISNIAKPELYDSFRVNRESRFILQKTKQLLTYDEIEKGFSKVKNLIYDYITEYDLSNVSLYLIRLSHLHQEMHNESFIFTQQLLNMKLYNLPNTDYEEPILYNIDMIDVLMGILHQGVSEYTYDFYFDNEYPSFKQVIKPFKVSKYCITNYQYLQFVLDNGYTKKKIGYPNLKT